MSYKNKTFFDFIEEAYDILESDEESLSSRMAAHRRATQEAMRKGDTKRMQELAQQGRDLNAERRIGGLLKDKPTKSNVNPNSWTSGTPQTPKSGQRDSRLGPTQAQRDAERSANSMLGSSVERGATVVRRNSDGSTTRVPANFTKEPVNVRSDATKSERRSGSQRTTERPEIGRQGRSSRSAENAPRSFRERG